MSDQAPEKRRKKRPRDLNRLAASITEDATAEPTEADQPEQGKNPHAQALGRLGGKKGGRSRAEKLTPEQRREIAKRAARARWGSDE